MHFCMENKYSKNVKRDIFERISNMPRYNKILELVIKELKNGNSPVVIENWTTKFKKMKENDELWNLLRINGARLDAAQNLLQANSNSIMKIRSYLDNENAGKAGNIPVVMWLSVEKKSEVLLQDNFIASDKITNTLTYFGHRDKNYISLFLKEMGYVIDEGCEANKNGLLITLGE